MTRELLQQALNFCDFAWRDVPMNDYALGLLETVRDDLIAAIAQPAVSSSGWKLVPLAANVEQVLAGQRADQHAHHVLDIYDSMLAAAPPAPEPIRCDSTRLDADRLDAQRWRKYAELAGKAYTPADITAAIDAAMKGG